MSQLQSAGYIPTCSGTDQANGLCVDSTVLPWGTGSGEEITISRRLDAQGYPQAVISFDLSTESREDMRRRFRSQLSRLFGYLENASGQVTYAIDRPSQALMMDGFVSRDGDRDMTGTDWDYGGTATLDNVVDVSYTGITDRTAITGLLKNGSKIVTSSAGVPVSKPTCPSGYTPTITTYLVGIGYDTEYTEVGNVDTWYTDSGSSTWTVFLRFAALDLTHSASVRTWHHRGSVGYFTWCDL
ncbi:hypothetical protein [Vibrio harveyi]|uniref:hypothetical protein n=2 Tax=Vibrionaceae TaxID=641 RepID=UPI003D743E8B